jgi:hypothetical protein
MSKTAPRRLLAAERSEKVLELRKAGATYLQCGKAVGVSEVRAFQICKERLAEINSRCQEETAEMRTLSRERLTLLLIKLTPSINSGDVQAIKEARQIDESMRRLLGLDAPTKVAPTTPDGTKEYEYGGRITADDIAAYAGAIRSALRAEDTVASEAPEQPVGPPQADA